MLQSRTKLQEPVADPLITCVPVAQIARLMRFSSDIVCYEYLARKHEMDNLSGEGVLMGFHGELFVLGGHPIHKSKSVTIELAHFRRKFGGGTACLKRAEVWQFLLPPSEHGLTRDTSASVSGHSG